MPRYHFHAQDGRSFPDNEGVELSNDEEARISAARYLAELLESFPEMLWDTGGLTMTVTDERGLTLFVIDLGVVSSAALGAKAHRGGGGGPRA